MESAKETLTLTKYFVSLPSARYLAGVIILVCIAFGIVMGPLVAGQWGVWQMLGGAASALWIVGLPSFISAAMLALLRRRVGLARALALSLLSAFVYLLFDISALAAKSSQAWGANLVFVGFGFSLLAWFSVLRFAFGLKRSAWIFSAMQLLLYSVFLLTSITVAISSMPSGMEVKPVDLALQPVDIAAKLALTATVFLAALAGLMFLASAPLKKNLGMTSSDALSMFLSQWLYGEKDLEGAFDEMGEEVQTLAGVAGFRTSRGTCVFVVPYVHFGPFGNLGGSQFSHQIASALKADGKTTVAVFHGTATHDFDPVSTGELPRVVEACRAGIGKFQYKKAVWSYSHGKEGDSQCHFLEINNKAFAAFTRAPLSTEDVNFSIGWALMNAAKGKVGEALVVDCHNSETGDVDYVESGSPIAFEMLGAMGKAMARTGKGEAMLAGWAEGFPQGIKALGSGGIKVMALADVRKKSAGRQSAFVFVVLDGNGVTSFVRERLIGGIEKWGRAAGFDATAEIFTTDTHQMNTVKGVFNPVGANGDADYAELSSLVMELCAKAKTHLAPAEFDMRAESCRLKVLGPYQSAEIVSTLNSVVAVLKLALPAVLIITAVFLLWALERLKI